MEGTVTEIVLLIIGLLAENFSEAKTIRQIAQKIGKPYPNTHKAVKKLIQEGSVLRDIVGHAHPCRLNTKSPLAQSYLGIVQANRKEQVITPVLKQVIEEMETRDEILMVWKRETDLVIITRTPVRRPGIRAEWITLAEFLTNKPLFNTINQHTLLVGNSVYPTVLGRPEVLR